MSLRHLGLRAQIVLSLAALLAVVFSFTALAMLWVLRASLESQRRELGTVAARVLVEGLAARLGRDPSLEEVARTIEGSLGQAGIVALGYYNGRGEPVVQRGADGEGPDLGGMSPLRPRPFEVVRPTPDGQSEELLLIQPVGGRGRGALVAVVHVGVSGAELSRLARPLLIYLITSGLLLLGFGYFSLTNLLVRPLEALTRATEQVAQGRLDVSVPVRGGREIASAAAAFNSMTRRLKEQKGRLETQLAELEQTTTVLKTTQDQLIRSARLASVGTLAAGVAHEVGNPVSAILGLTEVMLEDDVDEQERRDYLARINREAERVNRIIRDLLEYARSSPEAPESPSSVSEAADAALGLMGPQKNFRLIDVQLILEDDLPAVALGVDQLTQVLLNLLMNAADAVDGEGEIRLRARRDRGDEGEAVVIEVSDTGPGVPEDRLDQIFQPFFTTKDPGAGTGLGLAMCEGLISRAGGSLSARNNPERGLTLSVRLPLAE